MVLSVVSACDRILRRYTPDPFVFAVALTALAMALAVIFGGASPATVVRAWGDGFWKLSGFTLQMVMILFGGYCLATAPLVQGGLRRLTLRVKDPVTAVFVTAAVSAIACWLNWGFGLVLSAVLAREMAKQVPGVNFRVLVAAAFSGFVVWHGGLSGSIPLLLNTPGNFSIPFVGEVIPLSRTLFSAFNVVAVVLCMAALLAVNVWLARTLPATVHDLAPRNFADLAPAAARKPETPSELLEMSPWGGPLIAGAGGVYLFLAWRKDQLQLDLNTINFIFLFLAIALHGRVSSLLHAIKEAGEKTAPLLLQYPFYAGLMGVLTGTSLGADLARGFVKIASPKFFPLLTFWSAGLLNVFIPSGGGQWAVQGPIVMPVAREIGASLDLSVMAVAWGDAWTNLAQPFWALPLLAVAGLSLRDIMGFCLLHLAVSGCVLSFLFLAFA